MPTRRVGVLGGTFDPFHNGHLVAAVNARSAASLDVVLLMVANDPWQKSASRSITPAADRHAMAVSAVAAVPGVEVSSLEIDRGGPSYTIETLKALVEGEPDVELFVVVGGDLVRELPSWHRVDEIRAMASLVVVSRPGSAVPELPDWRVVHVTIPGLDISSTDLRRRAEGGEPLDGLTPPGVVRFVADNGLYAGRR